MEPGLQTLGGAVFPAGSLHPYAVPGPAPPELMLRVWPDHLHRLALELDFDWASIGAQIGMHPLQARQVWFTSEELMRTVPSPAWSANSTPRSTPRELSTPRADLGTPRTPRTPASGVPSAPLQHVYPGVDQAGVPPSPTKAQRLQRQNSLSYAAGPSPRPPASAPVPVPAAVHAADAHAHYASPLAAIYSSSPTTPRTPVAASASASSSLQHSPFAFGRGGPSPTLYAPGSLAVPGALHHGELASLALDRDLARIQHEIASASSSSPLPALPSHLASSARGTPVACPSPPVPLPAPPAPGALAPLVVPPVSPAPASGLGHGSAPGGQPCALEACGRTSGPGFRSTHHSGRPVPEPPAAAAAARPPLPPPAARKASAPASPSAARPPAAAAAAGPPPAAAEALPDSASEGGGLSEGEAPGDEGPAFLPPSPPAGPQSPASPPSDTPAASPPPARAQQALSDATDSEDVDGGLLSDSSVTGSALEAAFMSMAAHEAPSAIGGQALLDAGRRLRAARLAAAPRPHAAAEGGPRPKERSPPPPPQ